MGAISEGERKEKKKQLVDDGDGKGWYKQS